MNDVNANYRNLIEELLEEKEALLKSEISRCKRVLAGKPYDRRKDKSK